MSGLYNMVFGYNKLAPYLLNELGISHGDVPRFRDCFLFHDGQSIVIYARVGGGNRSDYEDEIASMRSRAGYLHDEDDSFDSTYALFHFAIPENLKQIIPQAIEKGHGIDPAKRWEESLNALKNMEK